MASFALSSEMGFISPELDKVYRGAVELHAPTLNGVVQVSAIDTDGEVLLHVERDKSGIHVARVDGQQLQVEINRKTGDWYDPEGFERIRTPVLRQPVDVLTFQRTDFTDEKTVRVDSSFNPEDHHDETWTLSWTGWLAIGEGVEPTSQTAIQRFGKDLGTFVHSKQEALYRIPRLKKKVRLFMLKRGLIDVLE